MEQNIILIDDRPERRKKILGEELNRQLEDSQVIYNGSTKFTTFEQLCTIH